MTRKLLFLATEDWFVRSHFLPLVRRAKEEGYEPVVAARASGALDDEGVRVIDTPFARGSLNPLRLQRQLRELRALLDREQPALVHAIALRPILLMLLVGAHVLARVLALTGRGYLAVGRAPWAKLMNLCFRTLIRRGLEKPNRILLVENTDDKTWIEAGRPLPENHVLLMPGAGIDPGAFAPAPEPPASPLVVGLVSRLVWSKGVDVAIAAVELLRKQGLDIVLHVAGEADADNPEHVTDAELARWRSIDGVRLLGRVKDINTFWAGCHIACLPSRGGEGLPRSLLEAAACGRPSVTTRTPGCSDFVRHGETGLIVPTDDAPALAVAIKTLASSAEMRTQMGKAAHERVLAGYTERHASDVAATAWRTLSRVQMKS